MDAKKIIDQWLENKPFRTGRSDFAFRLEKIGNARAIAAKIFDALNEHGKPIGPLPYTTNPEKIFIASFSPRRKRDRRVVPAIHFRTCDAEGNPAEGDYGWKCEADSLLHMLETGDRYGIEGKGGTRGTLHAHALVPLVDHMITELKLIALDDIEYVSENS